MKIKIKHKNIIFGLILLSVFGFLQIFNSIEIVEQLEIVSIDPNVPKIQEETSHVFSENVKFKSKGSNGSDYTNKEIKLDSESEKEKIITKDLEEDQDRQKNKDFIVEDWWMHTNGDVGLGNDSIITNEIFKVELPKTIINNKTYTTESIVFESIVFHESIGHFKFKYAESSMDKKHWHQTESTFDTPANDTNSIDGTEEIKDIKINTPMVNDEIYQTIYTFNDDRFHSSEGKIGASSIMVSWNKKQNYMLVKLTNCASIKDMSATDKVGYSFTTSIDINYNVNMVFNDSEYSLENDIFNKEEIDEKTTIDYHDKTQKNIDNFGIISGGNGKGDDNEKVVFNYWEKPPFFTKYNTYQDVADLLLSQRIIESKDGIPLDPKIITFTFYIDSTLTKEIPITNNLGDSQIHFKLSTKGKDNIIKSSTNEDANLNFTIPFMNVDINKKTKKGSLTYDNLFVFDDLTNNDPTDNEISNLRWLWDEDKKGWTLYSNTPIEIKIHPNEMKELYDGISSGSIPANVEICDSQNFIDKKGRTNSFEQNIKFINNLNEVFSFKYKYESNNENKNDVKINTNDSFAIKNDFRELKVESPSIPNDDKEPAEIFRTNITKETFSVKGNENNKGNYSLNEYVYDTSTGEWKKTPYSEGIEITAKGIYGFSSIDDNGLVSFEVVEYIDNDSLPLSTSFYNTKRYQADKDIALEHGITDFENLNPHEIRKIESKNKDGIDLGNVVIKNEILEAESEKVLGGREFKYLREVLDNKIYLILNDEFQIAKEDAKIEWKVNGKTKDVDEEIVKYNDTLSFTLLPTYSWNTKGKYESGDFHSQTASDISKLPIDSDKLEKVSNSYEHGTKFSEIKDSLNENIYKQWGLTSKDIKISWNLKDDYIVTLGTELDYSIGVIKDTWSGTNEGSFNSKTYFDLKKTKINNFNIQAITVDHVGETFIKIKPLLEAEINSQLTAFGYDDIDKLKIIWSYTKGGDDDPMDKIEDGDIMQRNTKIWFTITSRVPANKDIYRNSYKGSIDYGIVPPVPNTKWKNIILYVSLTLIIIVLAVILLIYVLRKNNNSNKKLNSKVKDNKLVLENNAYIASSLKEEKDKEENFEEENFEEEKDKEEILDENQITGIQEFSNENQSREIEQRFDED